MATTAASCLPGAIKAIAVALLGDATLATLLGGAHVYTKAPRNQAAPYVWVLSGTEVPDNQLKTFGRVATLHCLVVSGYDGTEELDAITSRLMAILDNTRHELPGYGYGRFAWVRNEEPIPDETQSGEPLFERLVVFGVTAR